MRTAKRTELPKDVVQAQRRFWAWRSRKRARRPLPQNLWDLAVRLVQRHGLHPIVRALKLDYYSLKKRLPNCPASADPSPPVFVELPAPVLQKQCVCEIHNRAGASMRLQLHGYDAADLEVLARTFGNTR